MKTNTNSITKNGNENVKKYEMRNIKPVISSKEYHELMDKLVEGLGFSLQEDEISGEWTPMLVFVNKEYIQDATYRNFTDRDMVCILSNIIDGDYYDNAKKYVIYQEDKE